MDGDALDLTNHELIYGDMESRNAEYIVDVKQQIRNDRGTRVVDDD